MIQKQSFNKKLNRIKNLKYGIYLFNKISDLYSFEYWLKIN
jgi:hypothetical protein